MTTTKRTPTRREREAVIDRSASVDFAAAVLKGLVEHNDAAAYFGSTGALLTWIGIAEGRGWIIGVKGPRTVTEAGRKHYDESGLEQLPKIRDRRAYLWNWSSTRRRRNRCLPLHRHNLQPRGREQSLQEW
jgi:hypothetical protein